MKPTINPVALGYVNRRAPLDYLGSRQSQCPHEQTVTNQEGFRTMASAYFGVGLPFGRKSTKGKLGSKVDLWICTDCQKLVI